MAIARVQKTSGGGDGSQGTDVATPNFPGSCTAGNYIIVVTRNDPSGGLISSITDTLSTQYNKIVANAAVPYVELWYGKLASSGTNAVTVHWASTNYCWTIAIEVSGLAPTAANVVDTFDSVTRTGVTDITSNPITTTQAVEYIILGVSQGFATYAEGANFTMIDPALPTTGSDYGGVEEFITSSIQTTFTCHITSTDTAAGAVVVAAFKSTDSSSGRFFILTHPA
jgi:hypothetical protein